MNQFTLLLIHLVYRFLNSIICFVNNGLTSFNYGCGECDEYVGGRMSII